MWIINWSDVTFFFFLLSKEYRGSERAGLQTHDRIYRFLAYLWRSCWSPFYFEKVKICFQSMNYVHLQRNLSYLCRLPHNRLTCAVPLLSSLLLSVKVGWHRGVAHVLWLMAAYVRVLSDPVPALSPLPRRSRTAALLPTVGKDVWDVCSGSF